MLILSSTLNFKTTNAITWPNLENIASKGLKGFGFIYLIAHLPSCTARTLGIISGLGLAVAGAPGFISRNVDMNFSPNLPSVDDSAPKPNLQNPTDLMRFVEQAQPKKQKTANTGAIDDFILVTVGGGLALYSHLYLK